MGVHRGAHLPSSIRFCIVKVLAISSTIIMKVSIALFSSLTFGIAVPNLLHRTCSANNCLRELIGYAFFDQIFVVEGVLESKHRVTNNSASQPPIDPIQPLTRSDFSWSDSKRPAPPQRLSAPDIRNVKTSHLSAFYEHLGCWHDVKSHCSYDRGILKHPWRNLFYHTLDHALTRLYTS